MKCFPKKNIMASSKSYCRASLVAQTDPNLAEPVLQRCFVKKVFLKSSQNLQEKKPVLEDLQLY